MGTLLLWFRGLGRSDPNVVARGREWAELLDKTFVAQGGTASLLKHFPRGPVAQASRIGGLPVPPYTEDPSFGSTM